MTTPLLLDVANWTDKQLDELQQLLESADHSLAAAWIVNNFFFPTADSRIMSDKPPTTLTVIVDVKDEKMVDLLPGIFIHNLKVSQADAAQTCAILGGTAEWGVGELAGDYSGHPGMNRWDIICVKNNPEPNTLETRWFIDDSNEPNGYYEQRVNTMVNKAYYDIRVVHGDYGALPSVPPTPAGYWTICEIYVGHADTVVNPSNIYDTTKISHAIPINWDINSRIYRAEHFPSFDPNTKMSFWQIRAPSGWAQVTGLNDRALRVVETTGGTTGGSLPLSSPSIGYHAVTVEEMASHAHYYYEHQWTAIQCGVDDRMRPDGLVRELTSYEGGGQAHTHDLNLAYVDIIICKKI